MHNCLSQAGSSTQLSRPPACTRTHTRGALSAHEHMHTHLRTCLCAHSATYPYTPTCTHIDILTLVGIPHTQFAHITLEVHGLSLQLSGQVTPDPRDAISALALLDPQTLSSPDPVLPARNTGPSSLRN